MKWYLTDNTLYNLELARINSLELQESECGVVLTLLHDKILKQNKLTKRWSRLGATERLSNLSALA